MQLAGWRVAFEPKALCWILMPETLRGLWRQRLRRAEGGMQSVLAATPVMLRRGAWRLLPIWAKFMLSVAWAYAMLLGLGLGLVSVLFPQWLGEPLGFSAMP